MRTWRAKRGVPFSGRPACRPPPAPAAICWFSGVSPAGVVEWTRTAGGTQGYVAGSTLAVAPDGSVLVTGVGNGTMTFDALALPAVSRNHFFVTRLTPAASPTATPDPAVAPAWYPASNPAAARVELHVSAETGPTTAELFDALGRCVAKAVAWRKPGCSRSTCGHCRPACTSYAPPPWVRPGRGD